MRLRGLRVGEQYYYDKDNQDVIHDIILERNEMVVDVLVNYLSMDQQPLFLICTAEDVIEFHNQAKPGLCGSQDSSGASAT